MQWHQYSELKPELGQHILIYRKYGKVNLPSDLYLGIYAYPESQYCWKIRNLANNSNQDLTALLSSSLPCLDEDLWCAIKSPE